LPVDPRRLYAGTGGYTAKATDMAGNTSVISATLSVKVG
jgi:hypothetical protein